MNIKTDDLINGVVHNIAPDFLSILSDNNLIETWKSLTPLARNEWICWIESAKKTETRIKRIHWGKEELLNGKRRPCCWAGCNHR